MKGENFFLLTIFALIALSFYLDYQALQTNTNSQAWITETIALTLTAILARQRMNPKQKNKMIALIAAIPPLEIITNQALTGAAPITTILAYTLIMITPPILILKKR